MIYSENFPISVSGFPYSPKTDRLTEAVTGVDGTAVSCFCWEVLEQCGMIVGYVRCQNSAMLL